MDTKKYNVTDLNPLTSFERHVFHRDQFAHYLRWSKVLNDTNIWEITCDFWCGNGNMLEVLYRNKFKQKKYIWIDIRQQTINKAKEKFSNVERAEFLVEDLVNPQNWVDFDSIQADRVCSFEVLEHVGKQNWDKFMENFKRCWHKNTTYYISTPNYDEKVWAAWNHTYDSWDWRWEAVQEFTHQELNDLFIKNGFKIVKKFWTFASQRDYKPYMNERQKEMLNALKEYYDSNLIANIMAPVMDASLSRNTLWILQQS